MTRIIDRFQPYTTELSRTVAANSSMAVQRTPATLLFADVSGYTRLTERLAALGRVGAELLTEAVNGCFTALIDEVLERDGEVLRFGGDALFIAFTGDDRERRGRQAAAAMQRAIRRLPSIDAPGGRVRLRQSMGLVDGELRLFRWQHNDQLPWVEVLPFGPDVTEVLRCEGIANAGQIIIGSGSRADRPLLTVGQLDPEALLPPSLRTVLTEQAHAEHRSVVLSFVQLQGFERFNDTSLSSVLSAVMDEVGDVQAELGVNLLGTDVSPDGLKLILGTGVPVASHDDAERLLAAARRVGALNGSLSVRLGAHAGVVFCGDVGHPLRRTYTVMGDAVNLTARLMGAASPGEVLASESLIARIPRTFAVAWREPFAVKGKRLPVSAGVVHARLEDTDDDEGRFIGRIAERRLLGQALSADSPVVAVVGSAGMGSTRLVRNTLRDRPGSHVYTAARVEGSGVAFSWARALIDALWGQPPRPGDLREELRTMGVHQTDDVDLVEVAVGLTAPDRAPRASPSSTGPAALIARLALRRLANSVLVVDGADQLDPASAEVVARIATGIGDVEGRMILTARSAASVPRPPAVAVLDIDMGPMSDDEIRELALASAHQPLSRTALQTIVERAGGNPRFTGWLVHTIGTDDEVPESLEAAVMAEFDRMEPARRQLVRAAAIVGDVAETALVDAVARCTLSFADTLGSLGPLLVRTPTGYAFAHDGVRAAVHAALPASERREMHRIAAHALESRAEHEPMVIPMLAEHWWQAEGHERAGYWSARAGDMAVERGATALAVQRYDRAMRVAMQFGDAPAVCALADKLASAADRAGLADDALRALTIAEAHATSTEAKAELMRRRAVQLDWLGRPRGAIRLLFAAQRHLAAHDLSVGGCADTALEISIEIATIRFFDGDSSRARALADDASVAAHRMGNPRLLARACMVLMMCSGDQPYAVRKACGLRGLAALDGRSPDRGLRASMLTNLGVIADNEGLADEALLHYAAAAEQYEQLGDYRLSASARSNQAGVLLELGRVDDALVLARAASRELAAIGSYAEFASAEGVLGRALFWAGSSQEGLAKLRSSAELLDRSGNVETAIYRTVWTAEALLLQGRIDEALTVLDARSSDLSLPTTSSAHTQRLLAVAMIIRGEQENGVKLLTELVAQPQGIEELFALATLAQFHALERSQQARLLQLQAVYGLCGLLWFRRAQLVAADD